MAEAPKSRPDPATARVHELWRRARPIMFVPVVLCGLAAAIFGPILIYELLARGLRESRPSWIALGVVCGLPYSLVIIAALRRLLRKSP